MEQEVNYVFSDVLEVLQKADKLITREKPKEEKTRLVFQYEKKKINLPHQTFKKSKHSKVISVEHPSADEPKITRRLPATGWLKSVKEEKKKKIQEEQKKKESTEHMDKKHITLEDIGKIDNEDLKNYEIELDPEELREFQEFKKMREQYNKSNELMEKLEKSSRGGLD